MPVRRILWPAIAIAIFNMSPASAATPSFDCTKAESSVEKLVCADEDLAKIDREIARLFVLARNGLRGNALRMAELIGTQRGWIKGRNDCWKDSEVRLCALRSYAIRIEELRAGYADARTHDSDGISKGPMAVACPGIDIMNATFIQTDLPILFLRWETVNHLLLTLGPSGSGARYVGKDGSNHEVVFWDKGREALFEQPGKGQLTCQVGEEG